jgi:tRNA dimethylallyltransferase
MNKSLVILGPTATGKTDLALQLAKKFEGELVAGDSRQIYQGLDVGTGKLPGKFQITNYKFQINSKSQISNFQKGKGFWIIAGMKIWLYDIADPKKRYDVSEYVKDAGRVIEDIVSRGKLPIIVGGTGLYLKALLHGLPNLEKPVDPKLREELEKLNLEELQEKLADLSSSVFKSLNFSERNNPRRLIRHIELQSNSSGTSNIQNTSYNIQNFDLLKIGLTTARAVLNERIDQRVKSRIEQGMIEEAENLHKKGLSFKRMRELGLEYRYLADYLEGVIKDKEEFITILQNKIHQYAKRQMTWFKKEPGIKWFDIQDEEVSYKVEKLVQEWYNS